MESYPGHVTQLLQRGIALAKAGRKEEARHCLERVIQADERNEQAWLWLSGMLESGEERRICLENVLAINPASAAAQRGLRLLGEQPPGPAAPPSTKTGDACPRCGARLPAYGKACPACRLPLIVDCPACGEYVDVVKASCPSCGEPLGEMSQGVQYYLPLAEAYLKRSRLPQAEAFLALAEFEATEDVPALRRIAAMYESLDLPKRAEALYERIIRLTPSDTAAYVHLTTLYQQQGQGEQAQAIYQQALKHSQDPAELSLALARQYLAKESSHERGIDTLEKLVRQSPKHAQAHLMLGRAYQRRRKESLAIEHYRQVMAWAAQDSKLSQEAQRRLDELQAEPLFQPGTGWGEVTRHTIGLLLPPAMAAWVNGRLSPLKISPAAWLAMLIAGAGAYLLASGTDAPKNPGMCQLFGQAGLSARDRTIVALSGGFLWLLAFGLILAKS